MRWASDLRPDTVVLQGDTFDTLALCTKTKPAWQMAQYGTLELEARAARPSLRRLAKYTKRGFIGPGNHEERVLRHVDENQALDGLGWDEPFRRALDDDGWQVLPAKYKLVLGPAVIQHGHTLKGSLNKYSAATVLARNPGQSTFYGHTHRVDQTANVTWDKGWPAEHMAATLGFLGDIDKFEYTDDEPWRLGFGALKFFRLPTGRPGFTFTQHVILRTRAGLVLHSPLNDKVYT